jgi:membrane-bound lytic murein transglycosylase A
MMTVGYTAYNGYEYKSVGMELVKDGKIARENLSLQAMIDFFKSHPELVNQYVWRNDRYVFFDVVDSGPRGSLNEPVTPWRTIATDKAVYPRACLAMISAKLPRPSFRGIENMPYKGFVCDQDRGGAIRAAGRCDLYVGIGDEAGKLAGRTAEDGNLYYLFLKPQYLPKASAPTGTPPGAPAKAPAAGPAAGGAVGSGASIGRGAGAIAPGPRGPGAVPPIGPALGGAGASPVSPPMPPIGPR